MLNKKRTYFSKIVFLIAIAVLSFTTFNCNAQEKLIITKGFTTKMIYKQSQKISFLTKDNKSYQGTIFLVTQDSIYLDFFEKAAAIKDIVIIKPAFTPNFSLYKTSSLKEIVLGTIVSLFMLSSGDIENFMNIWMPQAVQDENLTPKQKRLNKKSWKIGSKYKIVVQ